MSPLDPLDALGTLETRFGHTAFCPGQEAVVRAVLAGEDVLAVMPTGSGKSIGYQLPAVLLPGTTLVVSPLIALMKDQVDELNRKGIAAAALHSLLSPDERRAAVAAARNGALRLLYVAPERFASESFDRLLGELPISRFAVDEAHCVSEWGHDFRPDYRGLRSAAERCRRADGAAGRPPVLAFTATATPEVREDVVELLGMRAPKVFVAGFDRPNLVLSVRKVGGEIEKRRILPDLVSDRRALVYAATRKSTERAAEALLFAGVQASVYHAGLTDHERHRVQDAFASGRLPVVCATNAFGMGIDRPDIEAVVHFEIPGSLEAYYQEIGRGGRDGRTARTTLLWNYVDVRTREYFIEREEDDDDPRFRRAPLDPVQRERKRELDRVKLRRMIDYADSRGCLRATLLSYFGEEDVVSRCGACGNCADRRSLSAEDLLTLRKVLSGVARAGERFGKRKVAASLAGKLEGLPEGLTGLSTTGLLSGLGPKRVESYLDAAVGAGLLRASEDVYRTLSLTHEGRAVMTGRVTDVEIALAEPPAPPAKRARTRARATLDLVNAAPVDDALVAALREWRREESARRAVPAYVVFHDKTLVAIAAARPASKEALARISGVGPSKLEAYGEAVLAVVLSSSASRPS